MFVCTFDASIIIFDAVFNILNLYSYYTVLLLLNIFITIGVYKICKTPKTRIILISAITTFVIGTDIITGSNLSKTSILGYDAIIGARYYGLGNEYMGVFVAVVLLFILPLVQQRKISINIAFTVLIFIIIIIGMPVLGANVGGTIMASVAFIFAFLSIKKHSLRYGNIIFGILLAVLMVALFAVFDIYVLKQKSHLGQALIKLFEGNIEAIRNIIIRKLQVNIRLLRWTIWSKILMATIIVMVAIFIKPGKTIYHLFRKYEEFKVSWYSILVGSLFGLVFNDSGVVVAATSNIFGIQCIIFLVGEEVYAYNRDRLR